MLLRGPASAASYDLRHGQGYVPPGRAVLPKQVDDSAKVVPNVHVLERGGSS
jgi:hypothetical protein